MSKIFRLGEGPRTYKDWAESPSFPYDSNARKKIQDPDGATAEKEITSIPSPFARIDLVKNAFAKFVIIKIWMATQSSIKWYPMR